VVDTIEQTEQTDQKRKRTRPAKPAKLVRVDWDTKASVMLNPILHGKVTMTAKMYGITREEVIRRSIEQYCNWMTVSDRGADDVPDGN
jgi:hypothetical protein